MVQVMKMLMPLLTPAAGVIHIEMPEGSVLAPGNLIGRLDLDDASSVLRAVPFVGDFPQLGPPLVHSGKVDDIFVEALADAKAIMAGNDVQISKPSPVPRLSLQDNHVHVVRPWPMSRLSWQANMSND